MPNTLKIKRGAAATIPQGQLAEPLFTTDTYDLYIGKGSGGNQRIQNYIASGTSSQFLKGDGSLDSTTYQATSEKGQNNGYASLDAGGKIPAAQLPSSVIEYKGTWNASTNTPTLADGTGDAGDVYIVSVGGTQNLGSGSITFDAGDWVMYNGSVWQKSTGSNAVASVNGQTGIVSIGVNDLDDATITSVSNGQLLQYNSTSGKWVNWTPTYISAAITSLNGLTAATQTFAVGTSGTDFAVSSSTSTHTFNLPDASVSARGLITTGTQTIAGAKTFSSTLNGTNGSFSGTLSASQGDFRNKTIDVGLILTGEYNIIGEPKSVITAYGESTTLGGIEFRLVNGSGGGQIIPLYIKKTGESIFYYAITASSFIKSGGTSSQFLKADGSVDSNTYLTTSSAASTYLPLAGGTLTGALSGTSSSMSSTSTATAFIPTGSSIPTNGMYLPSANTVAISANSTKVIQISDSGRMSIGATTPTTDTLTVHGAITTTNGGTITAAGGLSAGSTIFGGLNCIITSDLSAASITPTGSTAPVTGMYSASSGEISFSTSTTKRFSIAPTTGAATFSSSVTSNGGNIISTYSSNTTTGNAFPRIGASNTNATQQDYNISELFVSAGNGAVSGGLVASYSSTFPTSTPSVMLRNSGNGPLYFSTNGSIKQTITSAGIITAPSQVSFKAYPSGSNPTLTKGTYNTIPYNNEQYDVQNNFSTSTYKFTAPVAGKYLFTVNVNFYGVDDTAKIAIRLRINSSAARFLFQMDNLPTGNTGDTDLSGSDILDLAANDTVHVEIYTDGSGSFYLSNGLDYNTFTGHLLG